MTLDLTYDYQEKYYIKPQSFSNSTPRDLLQYAVGALLYMPATQNIAEKLIEHPEMFQAICFDFEDALASEDWQGVCECLIHTLRQLQESDARLPLIFIRVQSPDMLTQIVDKLTMANVMDMILGFNLPKFDSTNAKSYIEIIKTINNDLGSRSYPIYFNPILETSLIMDQQTRLSELNDLKGLLASVSNYVLTIRVGANDFSHLFGLRRGIEQSIYQMPVIVDCLVAILNQFATDYVVSGPVWEYYGTEQAKEGLAREVTNDLLAGFIGKTAIHPSQLPTINQQLVVSYEDYQDALHIYQMELADQAVAGSHKEHRMNETKTHTRWASKVLKLAYIYGVKTEKIEK